RVDAPGARPRPDALSASRSMLVYSLPAEVLRVIHDLACHDAAAETFAETLRRLVLLSETLPARALAFWNGHSFRRQTWKASLSARSTPTFPAACSQDSGRQLESKLPVNRLVVFGVTYCMIEPGAKPLLSFSGKP